MNPERWYEMVWQQWMRCHGYRKSDFLTGFGWKFQIFSAFCIKNCHGMRLVGLQMLLGHSKTFIGPIGMIWNGLAAMDEMSWLQKKWLFDRIWLKVLNFWCCLHQKLSCHETSKPSDDVGSTTDLWWTHRDDMKWFGNNGWGLMASESVTSRLDLHSYHRLHLVLGLPSELN
jgi:hypothetical protein